MKMNQMLAVGTAGVFGCVLANAAQSQVRTNGLITTMTLPGLTAQAAPGIDFANAKPMPLPAIRTLPPSAADALRNALEPVELFGPSGASAGGSGDGEKNSLQLVSPVDIPQGSEAEGLEPDAYGTSLQVYTTDRVNAGGDLTVDYSPFRAAGKLFFKIGPTTYVCSASLIKPGIVVTAAHCVAPYGQKQFYSGWTLVPAYNNGSAPYGSWTARSASILTAYYNGTDNCSKKAPPGVICPDDVAVLTENPQNGRYPGNSTGWFGYGWNGYGFNPSSQALISELGYPGNLDGGSLMERTDSQGFVDRSNANNTVIGTAMQGGSSGGPWMVNLGIQPLGFPASHAAQPNTVVGVTSWGFTNPSVQQQGASPFTSANIVGLVNAVCTATPGAC